MSAYDPVMTVSELVTTTGFPLPPVLCQPIYLPNPDRGMKRSEARHHHAGSVVWGSYYILPSAGRRSSQLLGLGVSVPVWPICCSSSPVLSFQFSFLQFPHFDQLVAKYNYTPRAGSLLVWWWIFSFQPVPLPLRHSLGSVGLSGHTLLAVAQRWVRQSWFFQNNRTCFLSSFFFHWARRSKADMDMPKTL